MGAQNKSSICQIFLGAVELDDPQARSAYLAKACAGGERLRRTEEPPRLERIIAMPAGVLFLGFSEAEGRFVAFTEDGSLTAVDPGTGSTHLIRRTERGYELSARLSPDGRRLVLYRYNEALVLDLATGASQWLDYQGSFLSVAFHRDSQRMAVGMASWKVSLYDLSGQDAALLRKLKGLGGWVYGVAYHPDGGLIAVNVEGQLIRLVDPESNQQPSCGYEPSLTAVKLLHFSPDGSLLATSGRTQEGGYGVEIWHVDQQRGLYRACAVLPSSHPVWSLAFSPDSRMLVSGGPGSTSLWQIPALPRSLHVWLKAPPGCQSRATQNFMSGFAS